MKKLTVIFIMIISLSYLFGQEKRTPQADYLVEFTTKLSNTQKRLTYLNKKSAMAKVGTETINGLISGTLFYDVKIKGMGATVTMHYENFCEEDGWIFNGDIITKSNMSQNGTFSGTIIVSGVSEGSICYDNVTLKDGKPGSGTYGVKLKDGETVSVPYTYFFEAE